MTDIEIGKRLSFLRKKLKISQNEFAKSIEMQQSNYSDIENGKKKLFNSNLILLFEKYQISIYDLSNQNLSDNDVFQNIINNEAIELQSCKHQLKELGIKLQTANEVIEYLVNGERNGKNQ
jgi:transcriptional regulator with XRE-family HTH domain